MTETSYVFNIIEPYQSLISRKKRFGFGVLDIELSRNKSTTNTKTTKWTISAKRLKGLIGYGITVLPFAVDVKNREKFDANTILVRNNSGFINGGTSKDRHSGVRWKMGDDIKCTFDHKNGTFSMFNSTVDDGQWAVIEKNIPEGKIFYPFVAFSDPTPFADSDYVEFRVGQ